MENLKAKLIEAYNSCKQASLGVDIANLGNSLKKIMPEFHPKNYGEEKLAPLLQRLPETFHLTKDDSIHPPRYFAQLSSSTNSNSSNSMISSKTATEQAGNAKLGMVAELRDEKRYGLITENNPPSDLPNGRRIFFYNQINELDLHYITMLYAAGKRDISVNYSLFPSSNKNNPYDIAGNVQCLEITQDMRKRMSLELRSWCFFQDQQTILETLASKKFTLPEEWSFSGDAQPHQILWSYLRHTFKKLQMEKIDRLEELYRRGQTAETFDTIHNVGIGYSPDYKLAAFNTGLVNYSYEPVIAVFEVNDPYRFQPYKFKGFCIRGEKTLGKEVQSEIFGELNRAKYFSAVSDCIYLDPEVEVQGNWAHIIIDGISRGRFPDEFIYDNCASALRALAINKDALDLDDLQKIAYFIDKEENKKTHNNIKGRLESALKLALKRVTWNFKTAIPVWYPKAQKISLLLPLALIDDRTPDVALVVEQIQQTDGKGRTNINYTAHTIYTLDMAYNNSRLVCKPDSDWLVPQSISAHRQSDNSDDS